MIHIFNYFCTQKYLTKLFSFIMSSNSDYLPDDGPTFKGFLRFSLGLLIISISIAILSIVVCSLRIALSVN